MGLELHGHPGLVHLPVKTAHVPGYPQVNVDFGFQALSHADSFQAFMVFVGRQGHGATGDVSHEFLGRQGFVFEDMGHLGG